MFNYIYTRLEEDYIIYLKILNIKKSNILMLNVNSEWSIDRMLYVIKEFVIKYFSTIKKLRHIVLDDIEVVEPSGMAEINDILVFSSQKRIKDKYRDNKKRLVFYINPIYKINKI